LKAAPFFVQRKFKQQKKQFMQQRNESLDALRGFAILTMLLSGAIAYGNVLPAWMFHAQVPPPLHKFDPSIPGITWVDLVFPFFLFSMGAAIPLSLKKQIEANKSFLPVLWIAFKRFLLLAFFALFTQHMKAWVIAEQPTASDHLLSMFAFVLLFFQFYENKNEKLKTAFLIGRITAFAAAIILLWQLPFWNGKGFDFYKSDIIILVLANMALFGTIIYYSTADKPLLRIGILPFLMAVFLAAKEPSNGWAKELFNFNSIGEWKFDWLYKFYFLKYLFIIIPGTFAGEMMLQNMKQYSSERKEPAGKATENILAVTGVILIFLNLYGLFTRMLLLNMIVSVSICGFLFYVVRHLATTNLYKQLLQAGIYLLLLGLCFDAYEGGIKKDPSTYSYYFVTSGLAFFALIIFSVMSKRTFISSIAGYFSLNGKNPMLAYVAGNLLLLPLLQLSNTKQYWDAMNQNFFMGLMKGVLFTTVVSMITIFFVKRKWFWKT
jgi:predicted acyltransferase